jgi:hypothetical protein
MVTLQLTPLLHNHEIIYDDIINCIQATIADVVTGHLFFVKCSVLHDSEACAQVEGGHFKHLL